MTAPKMPVVELVHLVEEDVYLLETVPWGMQLELNGLPVKAPAAIDDPHQLRRVVPTRTEVVGYVSADHMAGLSVERYNELRSQLLEPAGGDEDGFLNIDDEYAYKKFMRDWSPETLVRPATYEPVDFQVTEIRRDSGDPDIRSLWNDAKLADQRKMYRVSRLHVAHNTLKQLAAKHGLDVEIPNHSGIRFAKIEGAYSFDDSMDFTRGVDFIGTVEQCKAEKARIVKLVEAPALAAAAKKRGLAVAPASAGEIREKLIRVRAAVLALHLKQSSPSRHGALGLLGEVIAALDTQIAQELQ